MSDAIARLVADLGDIPHSRDPDTLATKSRDYFWFSPILKEELEGLTAELVVMPRSRDDVIRVAAACARHRVPITARGAGTGNFGQAVPLAGGVVLDMSGLNRLLWHRDDVMRAEAGIVVGDLDAQLRRKGWELRMHPSTKRTATLGGFMAGGHAGIGSVTFGILRDRGNILGIELVTIEERPRVLEIRGDQLAWVHHAYGVNGIITAVELPLAPAYAWRDVILAFDTLPAAARFGWALATADGLAKKLVSPIAWELARHFTRLTPVLPAGKAIVIAMVSAASMEGVKALAAEMGGALVLDAAEGAHDGTPLYEYTWGHTTLQVLRDEPAATYFISIFGGADPLAQVELIDRKHAHEAPLHLELKRINGRMALEGIPVIRYTGRDQLKRLYEAFEADGVRIANGHTYFLQNGGMKTIDAAQIAFKRATDPHGLMNPGKIAGVDEIAGAEGGAAALKASGWAY
jgi:FAD/FMN-containing dehydrogenase